MACQPCACPGILPEQGRPWGFLAGCTSLSPAAAVQRHCELLPALPFTFSWPGGCPLPCPPCSCVASAAAPRPAPCAAPAASGHPAPLATRLLAAPPAAALPAATAPHLPPAAARGAAAPAAAGPRPPAATLALPGGLRLLPSSSSSPLPRLPPRFTILRPVLFGLPQARDPPQHQVSHPCPPSDARLLRMSSKAQAPVGTAQLGRLLAPNNSEAVDVLDQHLASVMDWMRAKKLKLNPG
uniref:protein FAM71E2-like n=1 Tax=Podarcis muralis TaxID=64176 RepID=UPI0010A06B17|nr:protein FAM71E2-like [Podarcis muralis]